MTHLQQETVSKSINNLHLYCFSCDLLSGHDIVHSDVTIKRKQIKCLVYNKKMYFKMRYLIFVIFDQLQYVY